jgi:hypothetical protein
MCGLEFTRRVGEVALVLQLSAQNLDVNFVAKTSPIGVCSTRPGTPTSPLTGHQLHHFGASQPSPQCNLNLAEALI